MGRPRKSVNEQKRNLSISLLPEQIASFEQSLAKLQEWVLQKYNLEEREVRNILTRSAVFGEFVDLIGSPAGFFMIQGVIETSLKPLEPNVKRNQK